MSSLLYYSIQLGLTEDEIIEIDKQVANNREAAYLFIRKFPSNSRGKAKMFFVYGMFIFQLGQPLVPCADAVVMPLPPAIHRLSLMEQDKILSHKNSSPQIALIIQSEMEKMVLTDQHIEDLDLICYKLENGSITLDKAVLELRGGDFYDWATLALIIYMLRLQQGNSFQNVPLPHMDPTGWASGKYDSKNAGNGQCLSHPPSRFERETLHTMKQMCAASADENGFVMSYDEAYNLVKENYSGSMQVTEDFKITDWQAASHLYHGKGVNVNPENFGITQAELIKIQDEGFIKYVQRGNKLPSIEHVRTYQKSLKDICLDSTSIRHDDSEYYNRPGVTPTTVFQNDRYLVCFNQTTGDLITGDKQRAGTIRKFNETNRIGGQKWINKWSK
jgi:hypothetical protein